MASSEPVSEELMPIANVSSSDTILIGTINHRRITEIIANVGSSSMQKLNTIKRCLSTFFAPYFASFFLPF